MLSTRTLTAIAIAGATMLPTSAAAQDNRLEPATSALALGMVPVDVSATFALEDPQRRQTAPCGPRCGVGDTDALLVILASGAGMVGGAMLGVAGTEDYGQIAGGFLGGIGGSILTSSLTAHAITGPGGESPFLGAILGSLAGVGAAAIVAGTGEAGGVLIAYPVVQGLVTYLVAR